MEHRLEGCAVVDGVHYVNDSKATSVAAVVTALNTFKAKVHLIAGGRDKGLDFTPLRPYLEEKVSSLILIGEAADKIENALYGSAQIIRVESLRAAVKQASIRARKGDVVLLSPGCASFDMFDDYEHRGREFKRLVHEVAIAG